MVTDSLVLLFTQQKMRGLPLSPASHCLAAIPSTVSAFNKTVATGFATKSLDSQKNSLDLKQNSQDSKIFVEVCNFA